MNICMIHPSKLDSTGKVIKYKKDLSPPLALAILDGLTPKEHTVQIINDFVEEIDFSIKYDLVAISSVTTQIARAYQIADTFRNNGVKVILGGGTPNGTTGGIEITRRLRRHRRGRRFMG